MNMLVTVFALMLVLAVLALVPVVPVPLVPVPVVLRPSSKTICPLLHMWIVVEVLADVPVPWVIDFEWRRPSGR